MTVAALPKRKAPRTNADAAAYWADGILSSEPMPYRQVNSVRCDRDVIYSFGTHYPMAIMVRDSRGKVRRVVVNSDRYGSKGWANTGWDQGNVAREVSERVSRARWHIRVDHIPLSDYGVQLRLRPLVGDLEPDPFPHVQVEPYYDAPHPGVEPTDDGVGCIAGQREEYSYVTEVFIPEEKRRPTDWVVRRGSSYTSIVSPYIYVERAGNGVIEYVHRTDDRFNRYHGDEVKSCPHCTAFAKRHARWNVLMNGGWDYSGRSNGTYSNRSRHIKGWKHHREMMVKFGGERGWREARRQDLRRVRRLRQVRKDWEARNYVGLSVVPRDKNRIPMLDPDGFVRRSHVEQARRQQRQRLKQRAADQKRADELRARQAREQRERIAAATAEWRANIKFDVRPEVAAWCIEHGLAPNANGTVTLFKAVFPADYKSGYGFSYVPGTTVEAPDFNTRQSCGGGLHFGPTEDVARRYHGSVTPAASTAILYCEVPLDTLIPLGDKCKAKSCHVVSQKASTS